MLTDQALASNLVGISQSPFHGSLEMTAEGTKTLSLLVIARSPSGRRGNLRASYDEIASLRSQ